MDIKFNRETGSFFSFKKSQTKFKRCPLNLYLLQFSVIFYSWLDDEELSSPPLLLCVNTITTLISSRRNSWFSQKRKQSRRLLTQYLIFVFVVDVLTINMTTPLTTHGYFTQMQHTANHTPILYDLASHSLPLHNISK